MDWCFFANPCLAADRAGFEHGSRRAAGSLFDPDRTAAAVAGEKSMEALKDSLVGGFKPVP